MARLTPGINFTGSLGNLSAYKMHGVERIVLRAKGGASKKMIQTSPSFENTRRINAEFSGRSTASKCIMRMLWPLKALADYNIAGPLNARMKPVQLLDTESEFGKRNLMLSKNPGILQGFSLNRGTLIESVIRAPLSGSITKASFSAQVGIPELIPDINFRPAVKHPVYSLQAVFGVIPDLFWTTDGYKPSHPDYSRLAAVWSETSWHPVLMGSEATTLALKIETIPPDDHFTLMLSVGIRFGSVTGPDTIQQVKYAGCAKILSMT